MRVIAAAASLGDHPLGASLDARALAATFDGSLDAQGYVVDSYVLTDYVVDELPKTLTLSASLNALAFAAAESTHQYEAA